MTELIKPKMQDYHHHVLVCVGSKCAENNQGQILYDELKSKLKIASLNTGNARIIRSRSACLGVCKSGPLLCVHPEGIWYYGINSEKLDRIIVEHFIQKKPVFDYIFHQANKS